MQSYCEDGPGLSNLSFLMTLPQVELLTAGSQQVNIAGLSLLFRNGSQWALAIELGNLPLRPVSLELSKGSLLQPVSSSPLVLPAQTVVGSHLRHPSSSCPPHAKLLNSSSLAGSLLFKNLSGPLKRAKLIARSLRFRTMDTLGPAVLCCGGCSVPPSSTPHPAVT